MTVLPAELERLLDPSYVEDLPAQAASAIRERLKECESVEVRIAYTRRLLHGKLDILRAELARRDDPQAAPLVDRLAEILADPPSPRRGVRASLPTDAVSEAQEHVDALVSQTHLSHLPDMSGEEISQMVERLEAEERELSTQRRRLHGVIDTVQAELIRRYKQGEVHASEALPGQ